MSDEFAQDTIESLKAEIEQLRQIRDELKETQERFFLISNANNDGIWDWNLQTSEVFFSSRWKEMLGYADDELKNEYQTWIDLIHEEDRNDVIEFLQAYLERKVSPYHLEFRLRCKMGGYKWILARGKASWDEQGNPLRFAGVHTDLSERKHRESMLKNLAQKERLLSEIARQLLDQDFTIAIQSVLQMIGEFTESEQSYIIRFTDNQQEWSMFYQWCNPKNTQIKSNLEQYQNQTIHRFPWFAEQLLKGQPIKINSFEDFPPHATIEQEFFSPSFTPILIVPMLASKKIVGYLGLKASCYKCWTTEDEKWLKLVGEFIAIAQASSEAEKSLLIAKENADLANQAKSEFLAHMSHELRTPLNAILGFTQVMNRDTTLNQEQRANLKIINQSGEHLLTLINDILEMSKIEAGRTTFHANRFDLFALIENIYEMFSLKAKTKHLQLILEKSTDVPQIICTDEGKLRQVLINLISNAIKFTKKGSVKLRVQPLEIKIETQEIRLYFEVEDTGIGIELSQQEKLFEPFIQAKAGLSSQEGTGLGLSISQKFVQLLGGEIKVKSILNQGSIFSFDIIAQFALDNPNTHPNLFRQVIQLVPQQSEYRILVVDDALESRLLLVKLLTSVGFLVKEAGNGKEAIALWKKWNPELIFMDLKMPVLNGYEAIQQIRKLEGKRKTIIIALTASAFKDEIDPILVKQFDDFILKPFKENVLWQKIAHHLKVEYLYEEIEGFRSENVNRFIEQEEKVLSQLKSMPEQWFKDMLEAAQECNDEKILELITLISSSNLELVDLLNKLVYDFHFDSIIELIEHR